MSTKDEKIKDNERHLMGSIARDVNAIRRNYEYEVKMRYLKLMHDEGFLDYDDFFNRLLEIGNDLGFHISENKPE